MKTLGMAAGREIDPSKSPDSLWDIWRQTHEKHSVDEAACENQANKSVDIWDDDTVFLFVLLRRLTSTL